MRELKAEYMAFAPIKTEKCFASFVRVCEKYGVDPVADGYLLAAKKVGDLFTVAAGA